MGKPAGRLGDVSTHGGTLILGAPTVLIGKMPAGTLGDMHVCPMVTGVVPHVGGPVALGSMGVLLGKKPAARVSDLSPCVGPPDMLAMGCMTVLIGEAGGAGGGGAAAAAAAAAAAKQNGPKAIKPYVPIEPAEPRTENHYVECTVVDSADLPLQGLRYKLTDPDGQKIAGAVATGGRIRHDGYSQAGSFKVEFACLVNVKWSKAKCKPGEMLTLKADAEGFENGVACPIMIFEALGNGNQRLLKTLPTQIQGNKVTGEWALTKEELAKVEADGPKGKVEYFFILVAEGIVGVSDRMQCLDDAKIEILDPDEKPLAAAKYELHLRDGSVRTGQVDKQGKAEQKDIPAGPYTIVLPEIVIHGRVTKAEKPGVGPAGGSQGKAKTRLKPSQEKQKAKIEEPGDAGEDGNSDSRSELESHSKHVNFSSGLDADRKKILSSKSTEIIGKAAKAVGLESVTITSTIRYPHQQAEAMYNNLANNKRLAYAAPGMEVTDVYDQCTKKNLAKQETIKQMTEKIESLSKEKKRVSKHCVSTEEYNKLNIVDIGIPAKQTKEFILELAKDKSVEKVFHDIKDIANTGKVSRLAKEPCIHVEIKQ